MINKKIIMSMIAVFFIVLAVLFITSRLKKEKEEGIKEIPSLVQEAENSIKSKGVLQLTTQEFSKFKNVTVKVYYKEDYCLKIVENVTRRFNNVKTEEVIRVNKKEKLPDNIKILGGSIEFPIVMLKENSEEGGRMISGIAVCSAQILTYSICDSIINPPEFCSKYIFVKTKIENTSLNLAEDKECYENCFVEYNKDNNTVNQLWRGPPCERIGGYIEGITHVINKRCLEKSCKSDTQDRACCNKNDCVYKNKCYSIRGVYDVDGDGQNEVCRLYKNNPLWIDPDRDYLSCSFANYSWFDCKPKTECAYGINNYGEKENGLCCGDDENEFYTKCNGEICNEEDYACCKANQCVYKNECYSAGCADIKTELGTRKAYCNGIRNTWVDLDEEHCKTCLGKDSWSGSFCCGDDENEGRYYKELIFYDETAEKATGKFFCVNKKLQCVSLIDSKVINEGCFDIPRIEEDVYGEYYCEKGKWYDPDYSEKYCEKCDFNWIYAKQKNKCCGDDEKEYFIKGGDGTAACCNSNYSNVQNGICYYYQICGNNVLEGDEECEPINTTNNMHCNQTKEICLKKKLGIRDEFGNCNDACGCSYDNFDYNCVKGRCNAECSNDKDCGKGRNCNISNCRCYEKENPFNFSKDCPHGIGLKINKKKVYINDTFIIEIVVYDETNKGFPNAKLWLDITANNEVIGSSIYSTNQNGIYVIKKLITKNSPSGLFKYVVKTIHGDCAIIGDSVTAEFIVEPPIISKKRVIKKSAKTIKRDIIKEWDITKTYFEKPVCGNNKIEIGEVCEGNSICRASLGCDYAKYKYDITEYCNNCKCPDDAWSKPNSNEYCENCKHCSDGLVNCGELCDNETVYAGDICKDNGLYKKFSICTNCTIYKNISSEIFVDNCFCDCPNNPQKNCVNGNYISYPDDYFAGCSDDKCNECICEDVYTKDSNNDGVEDKCSGELCGNRIDDNDNGIIDEKECAWYYCSQCGQNFLNLCDKEECSNFKEGCFFEEAVFGYGFCSKCSLLSSCEDYDHNKDNCINDACDLGLCFWNNFICCTDIDKDNICDYNDNCAKIFNPLQEDMDNDGRGDKCEFCYKERYLFYPQEQNETYCDDVIDNDCDYLIDCEDNDCFVKCMNISKGVVNESK